MMNIKDKVIEICKLLDELDEYDDTLFSSLNLEQDKMQDLLHLIEFNKLNTAQCYRAIRELNNVRNRRRKIKNDIELMRTFKDNKIKLPCKENRPFLLSEIGKTEKVQNSRVYTYKGYTEDEIKELIGE